MAPYCLVSFNYTNINSSSLSIGSTGCSLFLRGRNGEENKKKENSHNHCLESPVVLVVSGQCCDLTAVPLPNAATTML